MCVIPSSSTRVVYAGGRETRFCYTTYFLFLLFLLWLPSTSLSDSLAVVVVIAMENPDRETDGCSRTSSPPAASQQAQPQHPQRRKSKSQTNKLSRKKRKLKALRARCRKRKSTPISAPIATDPFFELRGAGALQLRVASEAGRVADLEKLAEAKADLNVSTDRAQWRAIHHAAFHGHVDCVTFLVTHKADIHVRGLRAVTVRRGWRVARQ